MSDNDDYTNGPRVTLTNLGGQASDADLTAIAALSTTGYLKRTGSNTWGLLAGKIPIQTVYTVSSAVATGTTTLPLDDTIPQNTEGDQYMSLSITPASASNILIVQVIANVSLSAGPQTVSGALFQDTTANALAAAFTTISDATAVEQISIWYPMVAGTTSATTFKFRAGRASSGTVTFNGSAATRLFGGTICSMMIITEYEP